MQAMISALMILVACGLESHAGPPTYGQVIEAMAEAAPGIGDGRLAELVSDLSLQALERGEWARSDGQDTVRVLGGRLRNRGRASGRTRHAETSRKRAQRERRAAGTGTASGEAPPPLPVAREVLDAQPDAPCERTVRRQDARDHLRALGFDRLAPRAQACLVATEVMALRYRAAAALLGLASEEQVRKIRSRTLAALRPDRAGSASWCAARPGHVCGPSWGWAMFESDYIVRQVRVLLESIAKAVKLADVADHAQAEEDLDDAYRGLLPVDRELFDSLDARSLLPLLGEPERVAAIAELQALEGELRLGQGNAEWAALCFRRALTFLEHAASQIQVDDELLSRLRKRLRQRA